MLIPFQKTETKMRFLNPFRDFSLDEILSQTRTDPLTGQTGRVFSLPFKCEPTDWTETVRKSREQFCPFCEGALEKSTPRFSQDFAPEGRIREGEATLIPNLVPFDKYAGVCIMTRRHYVPMEDWTPEIMTDAFRASLRFLSLVAQKDPSVNTFYINWNYMPPAGSSIVHPHLQPNSGEIPTNEHRLQIQGAGTFREKTGKNFWEVYMEAERETRERYIADIGSTFWTMSFVPMGFLPDIWCIFSNRISLLDIQEEELSGFLRGLSATISYFASEQIPGFNMSLFSVRKDDDFRVNARICPRLLPRPIGNSDIAYLQMLHREPFCVRYPESARGRVEGFFKDLSIQ